MKTYRITKIKDCIKGKEYTFEDVVRAETVQSAMNQIAQFYPDANLEGAHCKEIADVSTEGR